MDRGLSANEWQNLDSSLSPLALLFALLITAQILIIFNNNISQILNI